MSVSEFQRENLKCESAKSAMRKVRKELKHKLVNAAANRDRYGFINCWIHLRLSLEGYKAVKKLCQKEGIILSSSWCSPYPEFYCFKQKNPL